MSNEVGATILPEDPVPGRWIGAVHGVNDAQYSTAYYGFYEPAHHGRISPPRYGPYQTAHRRFQNWVKSGVMEKLLITLAQHLKDAGGLDLKECFVDGTFVPASKRATRRENQAGQGHQDHGHYRRPWSSSRPAGQKALRPAEVKLVPATLEARIVARRLSVRSETKRATATGSINKPLAHQRCGTKNSLPQANKRNRRVSTTRRTTTVATLRAPLENRTTLCTGSWLSTKVWSCAMNIMPRIFRSLSPSGCAAVILLRHL